MAIITKGLGLLTRAFLKNANRGYRDIALPPTFFYPLGVYQAQDIISGFAIENQETNFLKG